MQTDEIRVRLRQLGALREHREMSLREASDTLNRLILEALAAGIGATEIATITGLARSRIYQIKEQQR